MTCCLTADLLRSSSRCSARGACWLLLSALLAAVCAGCSGGKEELDSDYGARRGAGYAQSVSGTSVLGDLFAKAGATVSSWKRLSPKLEQADVIVWATNTFKAPSADERRWLENWLRKKPNRTLVYIGRDYDGAGQYWSKVQPLASAEEAPEYARRLAQAK